MRYTNGSIEIEAVKHTGSYPKSKALCKKYSDLFPAGGFWGKWNGDLWLYTPEGMDTIKVGDWLVETEEGLRRRTNDEMAGFEAVE